MKTTDTTGMRGLAQKPDDHNAVLIDAMSDEAKIKWADTAYAKDKVLADLWDSAHREVWYWLMPERYAAMVGVTGNGRMAQTLPFFDHLFDGEPTTLLQEGAGQVAEALHPWESVWVRYKPRERIVAREDSEQSAEEEVEDEMMAQRASLLTQTVHELLNASNFHTEAASAHEDWLIGTAFLAADRDPYDDTKITWQALPPNYFVIGVDPAVNAITRMFRTQVFEAGQLLSIFGSDSLPKWPADIRMRIESEPLTEVKVRIVYRREKNRDGRAHWAAFAYPIECENDTRKCVWMASYRTDPVICYRCRPRIGIPWGVGPGISMLPDIKTLHTVRELALKNASISVVGIWQAEDDNVLNPDLIRLIPGTIIPHAKDSKGLTPLNPPGDFQIADFMREQLVEGLKRKFFIARVEERDMTLGEFQDRKSEVMRDMRADYGQLKFEFVVKVANRTTDLAEQMGKLAKADIDARLDMELTGPLAQDVGMAELDNVGQAMAVLAQTYGEGVVALLNNKEYVEFVVRRAHADRKLFKVGDDAEEFFKGIEDQAAQYMAQGLAQQAQELGQNFAGEAPGMPGAGAGMPGAGAAGIDPGLMGAGGAGVPGAGGDPLAALTSMMGGQGM